MKAQNGGNKVQHTDAGLETTYTGNSKVKSQRHLIIEDGKVFDDDSKKSILFREILDKFVCEVPKVIQQFSEILTGA